MTDSSGLPSTPSPSEWETTSFGAIAEFINGYAFKPADWSQFGLPIIRITQMLDGQAAVDHYEDVLSEAYRIDNGDLLFSWSATLATVIWNRGPAWLNQHLFKVVSKTDNVVRFLHHLIDFHIEKLAAQSHGTTMRHIKREDLLPYRVHRPKPHEQSRIAAVLDTVDEAIGKTEAVIAKLKQVRVGLLYDLLTRGLDERGQIRNPIAYPEQFQDSPLGSIPCQWELRPLKECLLRSPQNGIYKPANAIGHGTILIGQTSITEDRSIDLALARRAEILPEEQDRYGLREGDILMSRVFATLEGIGQPALVPSLPEPAVFESNMMCLRVNPEIIASPLLFHWLMSTRIRHKVVSCVNLSNQASINQLGLNSLPVVVPAPPEQQRILDAIRVQYQSVQAESIELQKLQHLKSGLMTDLLTGRVRVPEEIVVAP